MRLEAIAVTRGTGNPNGVLVVFNRPLSDDEMVMFHEMCQQAARSMDTLSLAKRIANDPEG